MPETATIPYGRLVADDRMVTAYQVDRGADCGCICPACRRPLIAHRDQGTGRAWHFQHAPNADGGAGAYCASAYETSVHEMAKQIILANRRLTLPGLTVHGGPVAQSRGTRQTIAPSVAAYVATGQEVWLADIGRRPDVMVQTAAGPLAIEVWVTHRTRLAKASDFRAVGLSAIEIGLSRSIADDEPALTAAILNTAPRDWLHSTDLAALNAAYEAECVERERIAAEQTAALEVAREAERKRHAEAEAALKAAEAARLAAEEAERQRLAEIEAARLAQQAELARRRAEATERERAEAEAFRQQRIAELALKEAEARERNAALAAVHRAEAAQRRAEEERQKAMDAQAREAELAAARLAKEDAAGTAQRCHVCQKPDSSFGFGLDNRTALWACREHRLAVREVAIDAGLVVGIPR